MARWATHRKDLLHAGVVDVAHERGYETIDLSSVGGGTPDILAWKESKGFRLVEIKTTKNATLTEAQKAFRARYRLPITYVHSLEDAREVFQ
jgi:VRR-NUC domain.